jgi:hypothetical protein
MARIHNLFPFRDIINLAAANVSCRTLACRLAEVNNMIKKLGLTHEHVAKGLQLAMTYKN